MMKELCLHETVFILFEGGKPIISIHSVTYVLVEAPSLFGNLTPDYNLIATKSRR